MATTEDNNKILLGFLEDLNDGDFEKCKWFLQKPKIIGNFPAIPKSRLENATRLETVNLIVQIYFAKSVDVTRKVLDNIDRNDLVTKLPNTSSDPKDGTASRKPDRPETEEDLDQSSASGEALQPGPEASNKALMDHGEEQRLKRDELKKYSCELTLDTNTVCIYLKLSDNNRKVTRVREEQPYPDHPERFDLCPQLLCSNGLTGQCYWEVEWRGGVTISVSYRGISRKGRGSRFGDNDQSLSLDCTEDFGYFFRDNNINTSISISSSSSSSSSSSVSHRVAVYVDCPAGSLSFYSVSSDSLIHIHTYNTTFTEPLYPGFMIESPGSSVSLCDV